MLTSHVHDFCAGSSDDHSDESQGAWPHLTQLICKQNSLRDMDTISSVPSLRTLDLSSNNIDTVHNLQGCTKLTELNLSHNNIESLLGLLEGPRSLVKLVLQVYPLSDCPSQVGALARLCQIYRYSKRPSMYSEARSWSACLMTADEILWVWTFTCYYSRDDYLLGPL